MVRKVKRISTFGIFESESDGSESSASLRTADETCEGETEGNEDQTEENAGDQGASELANSLQSIAVRGGETPVSLEEAAEHFDKYKIQQPSDHEQGETKNDSSEENVTRVVAEVPGRATETGNEGDDEDDI